MVDQALVTSGYDIEVALGERYLQYLLLLALDTGVIPTTRTFTEPPEVAGLSITLQVPNTLDRTYPPMPGAVEGALGSSDRPFSVELLVADPAGADAKVRLLCDVVDPARNLDVPGAELFLHVRLLFAATHDETGVALAEASLGVELVDLSGPLVDVAVASGADRQVLLAQVAAAVDRTLDLGEIGSRGRLQDLGLRKFAATPTAPAALVLYANLRLRGGAQEDNIRPTRGDVFAGQNILDAEHDIVFATRAGIYHDLGDDAYHRKAVPDGSGYDHPLILKGERQGSINDITVSPMENPDGSTLLHIAVDGEISIDNLPNPGFTLHLYLGAGTDDEGIMAWSSDGEIETGLLADILLGALAALTVPIFGPYAVLVFAGLEVAKSVALDLISDAYVEPKVDDKVDKTLFDVWPGRLPVIRKRWDPFVETNYQIGLRDHVFLCNDKGLVIAGRAALTRAPGDLVTNAVIREAVVDADDVPQALRFRVADADAHRDLFDDVVVAATRGTVVQPDPVAEPLVYELSVDETVSRVDDLTVVGRTKYTVERVEMSGTALEELLVLSDREIAEVRSALVGAHVEAATARITADEEPGIRQQVLGEFAAAGVIPTPEQVDTEVAARLQALIDADRVAYEEGDLAADLAAGLSPLLRFHLQPTWFGSLQDANVLTLEGFDLVHLRSGRSYYRDHYDAKVEKTPAQKLADNLVSRPTFHSTPAGVVLD